MIQFNQIKKALSELPLYKYAKQFILHYFVGLYERIDAHHTFLMGGGLAFSVISCIIPFVLILFSGLGVLLEIPAVESHIMTIIERAIPFEESSLVIQDFIFKRIHEFKMFKTMAGYLGVIVLLFTSSGLFSSLRTILNSTYGSESAKSAIVSKMRDMGMVFFVILFVFLTTILLSMLDIFGNLVGRLPLLSEFQVELLHKVVLALFSLFILFLVLWLVYYFVPEIKMERKVAALSAFWFAILWTLANKVFGYYIANVASLKNIYGAYVFIIIGILWVYYSALVFIISAEIGQLYRLRLDSKQ